MVVVPASPVQLEGRPSLALQLDPPPTSSASARPRVGLAPTLLLPSPHPELRAPTAESAPGATAPPTLVVGEAVGFGGAASPGAASAGAASSPGRSPAALAVVAPALDGGALPPPFSISRRGGGGPLSQPLPHLDTGDSHTHTGDSPVPSRPDSAASAFALGDRGGGTDSPASGYAVGLVEGGGSAHSSGASTPVGDARGGVPAPLACAAPQPLSPRAPIPPPLSISRSALTTPRGGSFSPRGWGAAI